MMLGIKNTRWHYESRVKAIESFAVKLESGRVRDPRSLEDFLACTLVVPTKADIDKAISAVRSKFTIRYRRPPKDGQTHKSADAFPFDDVRLYCIAKADKTAPPRAFDNIIFEIQIKTFLQHAWGIATHDFTYKTDKVSWGKDRIVAHLKAAIEHVELSLHEAATLSASSIVALTNRESTALSETIDVLKKYWDRSDLPENLKSTARTITEINSILKYDIRKLDDIISAFKTHSKGMPLNLSPYSAIISAILHSDATYFDASLSAGPENFTVFITPEIALPPGFPSPKAARKLIKLA
ncbi:hypothetical protein [Mesorhizobium sp. 1M-11]|uniref:hypothetical protein n=1 Tax=Mesorhizobium sp. 1M-11 TaxID=1529006 RepID=UPI00137971F8|nr:hypothetical protein [Mesorhizobium sp. 1M-11]